MERYGIILAGGKGTRLYPNTVTVSKQLIPLYSKPTVYYPLATLLLSGIRKICIISSPDHLGSYRELLGNGEKFGAELHYAEQEKPGGLAEAFLIAAPFLNGNPSALILGDNIFFGTGLQKFLSSASSEFEMSTIFSQFVSDPERYGVAEFNEDGRVVSIEEKPESPKSNNAVVGLYFYDGDAPARAAQLERSGRGELEITDLNLSYLADEKLKCLSLPRGTAWFDMGTPGSMADAANFVRSIEDREGQLVCSPEEVAFTKGYLSPSEFEKIIEDMPESYYREMVSKSFGKN